MCCDDCSSRHNHAVATESQRPLSFRNWISKINMLRNIWILILIPNTLFILLSLTNLMYMHILSMLSVVHMRNLSGCLLEASQTQMSCFFKHTLLWTNGICLRWMGNKTFYCNNKGQKLITLLIPGLDFYLYFRYN